MRRYKNLFPLIAVMICFLCVVVLLGIQKTNNSINTSLDNNSEVNQNDVDYYYASGKSQNSEEIIISNGENRNSEEDINNDDDRNSEEYKNSEEYRNSKEYRNILKQSYESTFVKLLSYKGYEDVSVEVAFGEDTLDTSQIEATIEFDNLNESQKEEVSSVPFMDVLVIASNMKKEKINIIIN